MSQCYYCQEEVASDDKACPHCGSAYPTGRPLYTFPSVIILFFACCGICYGYLRELAGLPIWLSVVLAIPIVVAFFAAMIQIASWSD